MPPTGPRIVKPTPSALARAGALIRASRLVAFPTETVYGLGADATSAAAVAAVYAAKARARSNPLIVHVPGASAARRLVAFDARARALARTFWPGPLTLVLKRRPDAPIPDLVSAGLDTLAVRVPDHPVALALLRRAGRPLAAPSANRSGHVSPTTAAHVARSLGRRVALILDGGPCRIGVESSVVDLCGPQAALLRPGGIPREAIEAVIGRLSRPRSKAHRPRSPGQRPSHYAPRLELRLATRRPRAGEAYLAFGKVPAGARPRAMLNLSPAGDLAEAAANLFAMLRDLDHPRFTAIAVAPIPAHGLGLAINDRLERAAAPRRR
ncbi:MAG: L-threonylcarbamoyladenylate synthase [Pseudomonadota bacterium]